MGTEDVTRATIDASGRDAVDEGMEGQVDHERNLRGAFLVKNVNISELR